MYKEKNIKYIMGNTQSKMIDMYMENIEYADDSDIGDNYIEDIYIEDSDYETETQDMRLNRFFYENKNKYILIISYFVFYFIYFFWQDQNKIESNIYKNNI